MGLSYGSVIDPLHGADSTAISELLSMFALAAMITTGVHREAIAWLCRSFIEIPPGFGRDMKRGRPTWVGAWIDGAMPFRAETASSYVQGLAQTYLTDQAARGHIAGLRPLPVNLEARFKYNQAFKSVYQTIPSTIMLVLILIPAMMTAVGTSIAAEASTSRRAKRP